MSGQSSVIVVGGGLAGLACAMKLAEEGIHVDLFSLASVRRSHSGCAQGGINACNDVARQQGFSEWAHFDETILGGDFLADQPPVHEMCYWAPRIVELLDRMGVPFTRTPEGRRALRRFGGSLFARTYFAGASTGRQLLYAFDEQVRRHEAAGRIRKYEFWEFLYPVIHDENSRPTCVGIVAQDLRSMQIRAFPATAVVMATGSYGHVFGQGTMSASCTGAAASRCLQAGVHFANPEFVQIHPTTIPGEDKFRLISEAVRGDGGRIWVPAINENGAWKPHPNASRGANSIPENERYYFLEEQYSKYGNLVPRDVATREIVRVCQDGLGVGDGSAVYLDLGDVIKELGREQVLARLDGALEIHKKFARTNGIDEPMKVSPAVHAGMGGLWVGYKKDEKTGGLKAGHPANNCTNVTALYAMGEASFAYHGANRLGGNGLLSRIFDGLFGGTCVAAYCAETQHDAPQSLFDSAVKQETDRVEGLISSGGDENPYLLAQEMGRWMTEHCTVIRHNDKLEMTLDKCRQWKVRSRRIKLSDTGNWANQNLSYARAVADMIVLAEAILRGALLRNESRGAHFKPAYPDRDDVNFLRTTIAAFDPVTDEVTIHYDPVDTSLIAPRPRTYGKTLAATAPIRAITKPQLA